jgi:putative ABC transport system permease protein
VAEPPRIAERLLRWLVGGRDGDAVAGDLREQWAERGRLWYWREALSCAAVRFSPHRRMLPGLGMDFHHAVRTIRRSPGYAVTAMVCLGLAMGVNTTLFALLDSIYFRRLPVPQPDRLIIVSRASHTFCSWREYLGFRDNLRSMRTSVTVLFSDDVVVRGAHRTLLSEVVSANYADVLRVGTAAGRWFTPQEDSPGAAPAAVISDAFWKSKLNRDPAALGGTLRSNGLDYRIVGIGPPGFNGSAAPFSIDFWVTAASLDRPGPGAGFGLVGRLTPGATIENAAAELRVADARLRNDRHDPRADDPATLTPLAGIWWTGGRRILVPFARMMAMVSGAVLLIACVNVANLLLSRAAVRQRELAIRHALGATRWRMFRARLVESLLLSAGGAAIGFAAGHGIGRMLETVLPSIPQEGFRGIQFGIDWRVAAFLAALSALAALLFAAASGRKRAGHRQVYSIAQVTLSLALLIATGLLVRGLDRASHADRGFVTDGRLIVNLYDPAGRWTALLERARSVPGVEDVTLARDPIGPVSRSCASPSALAPPRGVVFNVVEPNYFDLMRIPILRGSGFTDAAGVLVNEAMARAYWPGQDAPGKLLWVGCNVAQRRILPVAGVVRDLARPGEPQDAPAYYLSRRQDSDPGAFAFLIKTPGDPYRWSKPLVDALLAEAPDAHLYEVTSVHDAISLSLWQSRWQARLLGGVAALAILLAAIGLYGVVACSVAQRTREIGVRMAIGAQPGDVQWMFVGQGLRITAIGVALGLVLSAAVARLMRAYLYGLSPFDPVAFAAASLAWIAVAMLASWWPARRATRVDPLTALKYE